MRRRRTTPNRCPKKNKNGERKACRRCPKKLTRASTQSTCRVRSLQHARDLHRLPSAAHAGLPATTQPSSLAALHAQANGVSSVVGAAAHDAVASHHTRPHTHRGLHHAQPTLSVGPFFMPVRSQRFEVELGNIPKIERRHLRSPLRQMLSIPVHQVRIRLRIGCAL